ncbi:unnamed protein product [Meganyctiphanes norvegica]|uniref:XK-related protein n=1 Tax=Meganyctiphanes norvegica TaxID=48144 RepID=A0AAV2PNF8_MEGNR
MATSGRVNEAFELETIGHNTTRTDNGPKLMLPLATSTPTRITSVVETQSSCSTQTDITPATLSCWRIERRVPQQGVPVSQWHVLETRSIGFDAAQQTRDAHLFRYTDREMTDMVTAWRVITIMMPCVWYLTTYVADQISDIFVAYDTCTHGQEWWCGLSIFFIAFPSIIINCYNYEQLVRPDIATVKPLNKWVARLLFTVQSLPYYLMGRKISWCLRALRLQSNKYMELKDKYERDNIQERIRLKQERVVQEKLQQQHLRQAQHELQQQQHQYQQLQQQLQKIKEHLQLSETQAEQIRLQDKYHELERQQEHLNTLQQEQEEKRREYQQRLKNSKELLEENELFSDQPQLWEAGKELWEMAHAETDSAMTKWFQACFESVPMLSITSYIIEKKIVRHPDDYISTSLIVSVFVSLTSACSGLSSLLGDKAWERTAVSIAMFFTLGSRVMVCGGTGTFSPWLWFGPLLASTFIALIAKFCESKEETLVAKFQKSHKYLLEAMVMATICPPFNPVGIFASIPYVMASIIFFMNNPRHALNIVVLIASIVGQVAWIPLGFVLW